MLGGQGTLLKRFFGEMTQGKHFLSNGNLIMYYFHFAGLENQPLTHISQYGLRSIYQQDIPSTTSLQKGDFSIYVIQHKEKERIV